MLSANANIAKNTMFLYFRMLCVMLVSIYTVRVVLEALGVQDYGIYQTVGGIVGLLSFLNGALGTGSSRFLTFELGRGNMECLQKTFSTLFLAHVAIAILVVIVAEFAGVLYITEYMGIDAGQYEAVMFVFQLSLVTAVVNMTQIPYTAVIIAHEKLDIYAYITLAEIFLKLAVAMAIVAVPSGRLEVYALLICIVQVFVALGYRWFCYRNYAESHIVIKSFDKDVLKKVGTFSGWSIFAQISIALVEQGTILMLNSFFSPVVVAARVVALQVNRTAGQFLGNFRTAVNPQIVKRLAADDAVGSKTLVLKSTYYSYYLMLILAMPIIILADPLLSVWLHDVPEFAVIFLQWSMVQSLFSVFDTSLYTALYAKGDLRMNALMSPTVGFISVPIQFLLFRLGHSPLVVAYAGVIMYAVLGIIIKPYLVCRVAGYDAGSVISMFKKCVMVTVVAVPLVFGIAGFLDGHSVGGFVGISISSLLVTCMTAWFLGMDAGDKEMIASLVRKKISGGNASI